jgi:hypothetical protein
VRPRDLERRLAVVEARAARLPVAGRVPQQLREYLASLDEDTLEAIETALELAAFAPRQALRPAEQLSDAEAVAEWRRLGGMRS